MIRPRHGVILALMVIFISSCHDDNTQELKTPPKVSTGTVASVTKNSATLGGNVTEDGNDPVTARGIVWSTTANPTTEDNKTTNGTGTGVFSSELSGLTANTSYFARAYAINSQGTSYGDQITFTTSDLAQVSIDTDPLVGINTATVTGNVSFDGHTPVTDRGFVWSTDANPTLSNSKISANKGTGEFSAELTNLTENTKYHVRAFATNSDGTSYSADLEITTDVAPTVSTAEPGNVTFASVHIEGGAFTESQISPILERGICWSQNANPTVADNVVAAGTGSGNFDALLDELDPGTFYYARAYATTPLGTTYGPQKTFTTLTLEANLKAYFTFDNTFNDVFGGNAALASGPNATFVADRNNNANSAVWFDGSNQSYANGVVDLKNSEAITMSFWFKPVKSTGATFLVYSVPYQLYYVLPDLYFNINSAASSGSAQKNGLTAGNFLNTWHHFAGVYDGNTMFLYVDGQLAKSSVFSNGPVFSNTNFTFGGSPVINYYESVLDDVRMYNRALSAEEVSYLFKH